ncbi:MAG: type IV pilus twitching motility protein PilT [Rickettsiales bacterium]|nr:type IV pilus twitching motility protein PilT [Rickettsiales bacterium]
MDITELLMFAQKNKASDLHLSTGNPPLLRINGDMVAMKMDALEADVVKQLLYSILTESQRTNYERDLELDFAITFGDGMRFRVNAFNTLAGPAAVLRSIPSTIMSLDELNAPQILKRLVELPRGLVLVTGPTGSGKSTTLAAMVNHINETSAKHILTIEDPVEFIHDSKRSLINHREVGVSTKSFSQALKSALREDPDIILVGEMRDLETIQLAMTAAETGHLVMGTLHTSTAAKTVDRIIDVFPAEEKEMVRAMLSVSIEAIVTQTLIKRADGKGRVAAHEILIGTSAVRNLIRENKIPQLNSMIQTGSKSGMILMKDAIRNLLEEGVIGSEEARRLLLTDADEDKNSGGHTPKPITANPGQF